MLVVASLLLVVGVSVAVAVVVSGSWVISPVVVGVSVAEAVVISVVVSMLK